MNLYELLLAKKLGGSGGGSTPTGAISISENGTYDVTDYASADVNVSPSGTINITENGVTNVADYEYAKVNVPDISSAFDTSVSVNVIGGFNAQIRYPKVDQYGNVFYSTDNKSPGSTTQYDVFQGAPINILPPSNLNNYKVVVDSSSRVTYVVSQETNGQGIYLWVGIMPGTISVLIQAI